MAILLVSKNCSACKTLEEKAGNSLDRVKIVDVTEASDELLQKIISSNIMAVPAIIQDSGEVCIGVEGVIACLTKIANPAEKE